jgi:hypothetical protein
MVSAHRWETISTPSNLTANQHSGNQFFVASEDNYASAQSALAIGLTLDSAGNYKAAIAFSVAADGGAAGAPTLTTATISCSNSTLQSAYGGRWSPCGIQLDGSSDAADYSTIAYAWRNAAGSTLATTADYTPPTGAGYTGLYLRVTVDAGLGTEIVVDSAVTTVAYAVLGNTEGSSNSSAQSKAITNNVGEKIYITANALTATGLGNATFEGSGPTAVASHANHLGNPGASGNRNCHMLGKSDDNEANVDWQFSTTGGSRSVMVWQVVGYGLTPTEIDGGGQAGNDTTSTTVTVNVPAGGAVMSHAGVYDGVNDPSGIQFFTGSTYSKSTGAGFYAAGLGYLIAANASLGVTATKSGAAVSKQHTVYVFTPEVPA